MWNVDPVEEAVRKIHLRTLVVTNTKLFMTAKEKVEH